MTVIAFDLSLSNTGVSVFNDDGQCIELISIDTSRETGHPLKLKKIGKEALRIKKKYKPKVIVVEKGFTRFNLSTQALFKVHGLINYIFSNVEQVYYHSTSVRKIVLGKGNLKKEDLQRYIIENYKDISFKDLDQSDAFGLGLAYFKDKGIII
jgi:Holliday junction resolvasome RuvABC endonuclease subunit